MRLLWYDDVSKENAEIIILRFLRVVFGVNSSPFLLNTTIRHHLNQYAAPDIDIASIAEVVERFVEDLYVDYKVSEAMSVEEGFELYLNCKKMMSAAGFDFQKWVCNNAELQGLINEYDGEVSIVEGIIKDDLSYVNSQIRVFRVIKMLLVLLGIF